MQVSGTTAVVTGGASGLGEGVAIALAGQGAAVVIFDRDVERGERLAGEIGATFVEVDVGSSTSVEAAFAKGRELSGQERILVNCAGIGPPFKTAFRDKATGEIRHFPFDVYDKVIQVNLLGTFYTSAVAAAGMMALDPLEDGERGVIINTSSIAAGEGQAGQAAYSAAKNAIVGMTLPIARDLMNEGVRVNSILPGNFDTPLLATAPPKILDALVSAVPFPKRLGAPAEFASLALEIIRNRYINGENIRIDAGMRLGLR